MPALIQVFETTREKNVHRKCAQTIGKIGQDKDSVKQLMLALEHENLLIRYGAAMSLCKAISLPYQHADSATAAVFQRSREA